MRLLMPLHARTLAAVFFLPECGSDPIGTLSDGSIRGTVTDNTGATVANATINLSGSGQTTRTANSGADGVYTFANVPAGDFFVRGLGLPRVMAVGTYRVQRSVSDHNPIWIRLYHDR